MKHAGLWGAAFVVLVAGGITVWRLYHAGTPVVPTLAAPGPSAEVLRKLARGVNLSGWLQHGKADPAAALADEDWQTLRALGFSHVRLLADPATLLDARGLPDLEALGALREAIDAAHQHELLFILALQLPSEQKALLDAEPMRLALAGTWRALASALRDYPPERLLLEPLNEPEFEDPAGSRELLAFLAQEIRSVLPLHTLVISGHRWSGVDELLALAPLADRNVVYAFHFYEPHNFTHQGASWGPPVWLLLENVPYPSTPERVAPLLDALQGEARETLRWHGNERWDAARLAARVAQAAQWAREHRVPLWCSEFGAIRDAPRADRIAWLRDARLALEAQGLGWTAWDYAGRFGLASGEPGARVVDTEVAGALGLGGR